MDNKKLRIEVETDNYFFNEEIKVNENSIFYSFDENDNSGYAMDVYLELDLIQDFINDDYHLSFKNSIDELKELCKKDTVSHNLTIKKLIFVNVITILETYLSDLVITEVDKHEILQIRLVEESNIFKDQKIPKKEIFKVRDSIKKEILEELNKIVYHNLNKVIPLFKNVLRIDLTKGIKNLPKEIVKRHDIIHRNGKDRNGRKTEITLENITILIQEVENIILYIEEQKLNKYKII